MPPVGQKRHSPNGAASAFNAGSPPAAMAGKNLKWVRPRSSPCMISPAVAIPGRKGTPASMAAAPSRSVRPGETMNLLPASIAALSSSGLVTVPAPTIAPSTSRIARIASSAAGVRRVTSRTRSPPATSASASATASSASSTTSTGITGAVCIICSIGIIGAPSETGFGQHCASAHFRRIGIAAHEREKFPARAEFGRRRGCIFASLPFRLVYQRLELARLCAQANAVAVAQSGNRPAFERFGRKVDGGRYLAAGARHSAVGEQRDLEAPVLKHAERRRQLVQFGHAVGGGALKADHYDDIAVQFAGLESLGHVVLAAENAARRLDGQIILGHGADLDCRAADIAAEQPQAP